LIAACDIFWAAASRLKSVSQRSKFPVLRQFSWLSAELLPASSTVKTVSANPVRRIVHHPLLWLLLFPWSAVAASRQTQWLPGTAAPRALLAL
jgi:uncharacterized membrane protein